MTRGQVGALERRSAAARSSCRALRARCSRRPRPGRGSARAPGRDAAADSVDEMSMRGMSKKRMRSAAPGSSGRGARAPARGRRPRGRRRRAGEAGWPRGSRQSGSECGHVASDDEGQLVLRAQLMEPRRVSTVYERPGASASTRETPRPLVAGHRAPRRAPRGARRPGRRRPPCAAACPTGTSSTRSSPSCAARLLRADQMAEVGRVERPAEQPDARYSGPDLAVALDQVLERAQLAQRRSARGRAASGSSCRSRRPSRTRRRR